MATIRITNLSPAGTQFFSDSDSYLDSVSDDELSINRGGSSYLCIGLVAYSVSYAWGRWGRR